MDLWSEPDPNFILDGEGRKIITSMGFHPLNDPEKIAHWTRHTDDTYIGLEGQKRAKMCLVNLLSRDGLLMRLADIKCPVRWLQVCVARIMLRSSLSITDWLLTDYVLLEIGNQGQAVLYKYGCRTYQPVHISTMGEVYSCFWRRPISDRHEPGGSCGCYARNAGRMSLSKLL